MAEPKVHQLQANHGKQTAIATPAALGQARRTPALASAGGMTKTARSRRVSAASPARTPKATDRPRTADASMPTSTVGTSRTWRPVAGSTKGVSRTSAMPSAGATGGRRRAAAIRRHHQAMAAAQPTKTSASPPTGWTPPPRRSSAVAPPRRRTFKGEVAELADSVAIGP